MIRKGSKLARICLHLAAGGSLNRFEAEHLGDHTLPQTVDKLAHHGLTIARCEEVVRGFLGHETICMRYWLEPDEAEHAMSLLPKQ